jgi:hypothetical protein
MSDNLAIWKAIERTDPKQVKEITGKAYKGHSPKPHYIIWKLTRQFGPVGYGFGWTVVHEAYIDGKPQDGATEKIHECRILFWWRDPETGDKSEPIESYGATKALYKSSKGFWIDDEDAAKKSLTDAITKAASWLGASADIFMGRWDDSKYQAELREEFSPKRAAAQSAGGVARAAALTPERRSEIAQVAAEARWVPAETPHHPETGEVYDERNPPPEGAATFHEPTEEEDPPSVKAFMDQVREKIHPKATRDDLARAYAMEVIDNIAKRKENSRAQQWFDIFVSLHTEAIARLPTDLRQHVRNAIALKQAMIKGEKPDPAEFGYPFGEPVIMGEVRIA